MITLRGVTKTYGSVPVVDSVDLDLGRIGVTSIIGPNGAGKSTVLSIIGRLLTMDAGAVEIDGLNTRTTSGRILAKKVALLHQDNFLTARLTVGELVAFGRYPHSRDRLTVDDKSRIANALAYLDLTELQTRFLDELSGGQRQRAFIAMVLAQDTDYVLLDEPLNNLDLRHAVEIMRLLRRAADEMGKRVVLVMHDINFASVYSDEIVAMSNGRIVRQGPVDDIMQPEVLSSIYETPIDVQSINGNRISFHYT
ncbi:ABC transporter ATP-binding protein [Arthrobacter sp. CAN_C5]|uniref:iron ABC transporter ATP-binding protein n=1 Tax=Arthrobacter sp. CAN_C5 TaxID=2760706 RepID=UPI001AE971C8|nr:ATP-binding cassette domain-containing protein [Arthrobacter sp. CAN_C5]MBP2215733.1 iron complex transport system ATP-binding protein [Arthrobacter sp. CAN_C5]